MDIPVFHTRYNGVPVLSKTEINDIGERLAADFAPKAMLEPTEIDIDRFATRYLGMKQDFQYLSHNGIYLGMTVFSDTDFIPVYDPSTNQADYLSACDRTMIIDNTLLEPAQERRYRFTVGHECAHDILHKAVFEYRMMKASNADTAPLMIQCRRGQKAPIHLPPEWWDDTDWMEWQANALSAAILMPRSMVLRVADSVASSRCRYKSFNYIYEVSQVFNTSIEAARHRLGELNALPGCFGEPIPPGYSAIDIFAC